MPSQPRQFLFILASARREGNAERLARRAGERLAPSEQRWIRLDDARLPPFEDLRHSTPSYSPPLGEELCLLQATLDASDIVVVSPVYWYNLTASAKLYLDYWSKWLRADGFDFKARMAGKRLWAVVSISDSDPGMARPLIECLRLSADYMDMSWKGALLGEGNRPGDVLNDVRAMRAATEFLAG
jgi:hypothetical protein